MGSRVSAHIRGNVVGYVALFFALGLGTAYAIERDSIKSKHIKAAAVKESDLRNGAVTAAKLGDNSVSGQNVVDDSLKGADVDESTLELPSQADLPASLPPNGPAGGALSGTYPDPGIASSAVDAEQLAANSVRSPEIQNNAVDFDEIVTSAVRKDEVAANAVGYGELASISQEEIVVVVPDDGTAGDGIVSTRAGFAECDSGEAPIAGGLDWDGDEDNERLFTVDSHVADGLFEFGWEARGANDTGAAQSFTVEALCIGF